VLLPALLLVGCETSPVGPAPSIRFKQSEEVLRPCESKPLKADVRGLKQQDLSWVSSEPAVVEISGAGLARARMPGAVTITATSRADTMVRARLAVVVRADLQSLEVGGGATDSIDARLPEPIFARASWAPACPAQGVALRFTSPSVAVGPYEVIQPAVRLGAVGREPEAAAVQVVTDSAGRAAASVRLGQHAGSYAVTVEDAAGAFSGTIPIRVRPGAPSTVEAMPRDTAVYVGATYRLRGIRILDRGGNEPERRSPLASDDAATATVDGDVVRAASTGRARILHEGVVAGSVSVVPNGRIAVARIVEHSGIRPAVVLMALDGSASRVAYESTRTGFNVVTAPAWRPDGSELVLSDAAPGSISRRLVISDTQGNARPLVAGDFGSDQYSGAYSPDGDWVYFGYGGPGLYRAPAAGEGSWDFVAFVEAGSKPSFSPDGRQLVMSDGSAQLFRLELATRQVLPLGIRGSFPVWSPRGDMIAYIADGVLWLVRPDGADRRMLTEDYRLQYGQGLSWSPDGRWLATRALTTGHIHLVDAESGVTLPLAFTAGVGYPAWAPR
jgi:hypothetical protein